MYASELVERTGESYELCKRQLHQVGDVCSPASSAKDLEKSCTKPGAAFSGGSGLHDAVFLASVVRCVDWTHQACVGVPYED